MTDQLWAPWRLAYVKSAADTEETSQVKRSDCFLCDYVQADPALDRQHLVLARGEQCVTVMNRYPYNNGHLLIAPTTHKGELSELSDTESLEMMQELQRMTAVLSELLTPQGFNIGLNLGQVAGAGLPGHLHWHIVPRWNGDTNFMPVLANVKVIPQSLEALYELVVQRLNENTDS